MSEDTGTRSEKDAEAYENMRGWAEAFRHPELDDDNRGYDGG